jgi:hypothetical protein
MPPIKRSTEDAALNLEEAPPAKRGRDSMTEQSFNFESLPTELQLEAIRDVAHQPNRVQAREDLTNLWNTNKHIRALIHNTTDLRESREALKRHPGVESRHVAVCRDVVSGISAEDALRQNGPLPRADEELRATDVDDALKHATPEHLANLADAFSARPDPAFKEALMGVGRAASDAPEWLNDANIDDLAKLVGAFVKRNLDLESGDVSMAIEFVGLHVMGRDDELLREANIEQIATLAVGFSRNHTIYENAIQDAMENLALQVTARGDELLRGANAEQLDIMKRTFSERNDPNCRSAVEKIDALVKSLNPNNRPQLEQRERSPFGR